MGTTEKQAYLARRGTRFLFSLCRACNRPRFSLLVLNFVSRLLLAVRLAPSCIQTRMPGFFRHSFAPSSTGLLPNCAASLRTVLVVVRVVGGDDRQRAP